MSITSVRLRPEIEKDLEAMAAKLHRSKSWVINQAVEEFLGKQEIEQRRWQDTLEALAAVERGEVISSDTVHDWLRSWGGKKEIKPPKAGTTKAK